MLADAVCCCASGRWYFLFLDSLYFEGTVNNPAFLRRSLNRHTDTSIRPSRKDASAQKVVQKKEAKQRHERVLREVNLSCDQK